MRLGAFGIDLRGGGAGAGTSGGSGMLPREAKVFGDGTVKANTTTLRRVGESLAALLALPEAELAAGYRNAWVYSSSFRVSQRDLLESARRVTCMTVEGGDWAVVREDPEEVISAAQEEVARGNGLAGIRILFALLFTEGYGGDYEAKVVDYARLGLEPEDLDEAMAELARELGGLGGGAGGRVAES